MQDAGDHIQAADLAMHLATAEPQNIEARYLAVLNLARARATHRALQLYDEFRLATVQDMDFLALRARLVKDLALRSVGPMRRTRLIEAAKLYCDAFDIGVAHYPAVNAATLLLLAGQSAEAGDLARLALEACGREAIRWQTEETEPPVDQRYFNAASRAEAHMVLGQYAEARRAVTEAAELSGRGNSSNRAGTRRQLRLICVANGLGEEILEPLRVPIVVHHVGHMLLPARVSASGGFTENRLRNEIETYFDRQNAPGIGFVYGGLACGSDILFAEAALARGIELNVVLPFAAEHYIARSVRPGGAEWVRRFESCITRAVAVHYAGDRDLTNDDLAFAYAGRMAMGLAALRAASLDTEARQVAVWDGAESRLPAGTAVDVRTWRAAGRPTDVIPVERKRLRARGGASGKGKSSPERAAGSQTAIDYDERVLRALLFGDIVGFASVPETDIPRFRSSVMSTIAEVLGDFATEIDHRNSWGDAIYVVMRSARAGARCALRIQEALNSLKPVPGRLDSVAMRVSLHYGPVFVGRDWIAPGSTFFGAQVTRTARIEPITPPGEVYATEALAAELALAAESEVIAEYVGIVPAAKGYGEFRMYAIQGRNRSGDREPAEA